MNFCSSLFIVACVLAISLFLEGCGTQEVSTSTSTTVTTSTTVSSTSSGSASTTVSSTVPASTTTSSSAQSSTTSTTTTTAASTTVSSTSSGTTSTTTAPAASTTVSSTSTTPAAGQTSPSRTAPMSAEEAVKYLNGLYMGFSETEESAGLGVTISMAGQPSTFYGNIFCSKITNPKGNTSCWNGGADCRLSASLYNKKMILSEKTKAPLMGLGRLTGFVVNQSRVENDLAKCAYVWDGASNNRYNMGCGGGAPTNNCDDKGSAFHNICPSTNKTCTASDIEVKRGVCKSFESDGLHDIPPTHGGHAQCVFPGPAFNHHGQADHMPGDSKLQDMARARVERNGGSDNEGANIEKWNEIVIDETLMLPDILKDPASVIPAFVYIKSKMPTSKENARLMRDEFCELNKVASIPLVEIDDTQERADGPFTLPSDDGQSSLIARSATVAMRKLRGSRGPAHLTNDAV